MSIQRLVKTPRGLLALWTEDGSHYENVIPVRAFPIQAPDDGGISLVSDDGHERAWIPKLSDLPVEERFLVEEALNAREFMPVIQQLLGVSSFATPSTWHVLTNRGQAHFILKGEEDIKRLNANTLLVLDSHGVQFLITDLHNFDKQSRKLLDRFL